MGFHDLDLSERRLIARRGTAFFAQRLAELSDDDLGAGSLLDGWTRKHLAAHVGYNAAALFRLMDWAATGVETPMYPSAEHRDREIKEGATLSAAALRNLFDHTVARLDEKWRHLPESRWAAPVRTAQGRTPHRKRCGCGPARCGSTPSTSTTVRSSVSFPTSCSSRCWPTSSRRGDAAASEPSWCSR